MKAYQMDSFEISQLGNLKWSWGLLCVVILMTHAAFWKTDETTVCIE